MSLNTEEGLLEVLPIWDDGFEGCWTWDKSKAEKDIELLVANKINGRWKIYRKSYANGADRMLETILFDKSFYTERGQKEFNRLFETKAKLFQSPKSPYLLEQLFKTITAESDLILDFFAGSGTTGHSVMNLNTSDYNGNRHFVLVQLPEPLDSENNDQKAAAEYCGKLSKPCNIVTPQGVPQKHGRNREDRSERIIDAMKAYLIKHRLLYAELRGTFVAV